MRLFFFILDIYKNKLKEQNYYGQKYWAEAAVLDGRRHGHFLEMWQF
jgi:hypothetical protein